MFDTFQRPRSRTGFLSVFPVVAAVAMTLAANVAVAAYPDKPIRLVVPFAPGGGTDLIARTLGVGMSAELGQQVIIDNKPGAGTIIGTDAVAKSAPDGYTIVIATFAHAVNPSMVSKLPYAADKAFTPITLIGRGPNVLVVRANSPFKTVKDIVSGGQSWQAQLCVAGQWHLGAPGG
ncbi:tripartite-type tricarboxylate transporter receptor subunit TctC [Sphaerotilus montanus]|uniref:Tripartite-type tricarboxylate transporter receptor subunit TctC n=1 Tax=Sphaerotilus montanus TaxID=522889 RepID=A0A7Y9R2I7_9BURK|nr:tripartite-type tricarboxylate transporter receptor subunit TctC [Sphaerotilus montanus]